MKFEYCKPVNAKSVPTGPNWIHEVKYDGYIVRDGKDVRLPSKKLGQSLPVDRRDRVQDQGEPVHQRREICVLDAQSISDFDALHSNRNDRRSPALRLRPGHTRWRGSQGYSPARSQGEVRGSCCAVARKGSA